MMNWKISGRKRSWHNIDELSPIKTTKNSFRIADLSAKI
jgi:hypothetical protein